MDAENRHHDTYNYANEPKVEVRDNPRDILKNPSSETQYINVNTLVVSPLRSVNSRVRYSLHKGSPYLPPVQEIVCQALSCRNVAYLASLSHFPDTWPFQAQTIQGSFFKGKLLTKGFDGAFSLNDIKSRI